MGALDRQVRNEAVTLRGSVFGHNYEDETEYDLRAGAFTFNGGGYSDLAGILGINTSSGAPGTPNPQAINSFRILQPAYGEIVECYIDYVSVRFATAAGGTPGKEGGAGAGNLKFAIGDFTNNNFMTPRTSYSLAEINADWEKIKGTTTGLSVPGGGDSRINASRLNLLPVLKKSGHAKFVKDGFNLLMVFNDGLAAPLASDAGGDFSLEFFRLAIAITGIK